MTTPKSRVQFFEQRISDANQHLSLAALDFVKREMNAANGFARHDGSDYYEHCVDVAQDLWNHGIRDESIIAAALLHDAIEDIEGVTYRMLTDKFNKRIADLVDMVTKSRGINYKDGKNLQAYLTLILDDPAAALIKTADRKHNFSTLRDATREKRLRQADETEIYFFPFFKEAMDRYPRYSAYFLSAKTAIKPHLFAIKDHEKELSSLQDRYDDLAKMYNNLRHTLEKRKQS